MSRPDCAPGDRLAARAQLQLAPETPVSVEEAGWVLGRELPEPPDAVDGFAPWSSWLAALGRRVEASAGSDPDVAERDEEGPITSWRAAARALGVSLETIRRARLRAGCTRTTGWFRSREALFDWWEGDLGVVEPERPARSRVTRSGAALDVKALVRNLTR